MCPQFFFRTNYYSIEIPHGVTAISLTYHPHHAKLQDLPIIIVIVNVVNVIVIVIVIVIVNVNINVTVIVINTILLSLPLITWVLASNTHEKVFIWKPRFSHNKYEHPVSKETSFVLSLTTSPLHLPSKDNYTNQT